MTDINGSFDQATVDFLVKFFQDLMTSFVVKTEDRLVAVENSVEALEKQVATLVLAYGEQAVFMEALVAQIAFATDEARSKFHEDINAARKSMLEVMRDASNGIMADDNQNIAKPLADMAEQKLSDTTQ